ncbi:hypothetical protein LWI29_032312 [Acer saccharum]|uniref:Uncharacterized protein n=1 Tax=Acer saccharum TaxID=4024 RepID=A0AA39RP56_ACESA|nr:hypothetical protein LWI29_032312 [Acer saccharum]
MVLKLPMPCNDLDLALLFVTEDDHKKCNGVDCVELSCLLHSKRRTSQQKHEHMDSNEDDSKNLYQNVRANDKVLAIIPHGGL